MKRLLFVLLAFATAGAVVAQQPIRDANAQVRKIGNFHGINIGSAFDVYMNQGNEDAVAVSASDPKVINQIIVEVKDGILYVGLEKGAWKFSNKKLKAYISFKSIDRLVVGGACKVRVDGSIKAENLKIDLSGASDLEAKLQVDKLRVELSGASDMTVSGVATSLDIEASGASKFKGFDLASNICNAEASGASDLRITVNKELSVHASGASDIDYRGEGVIRDLKTSGASSVSRRPS